MHIEISTAISGRHQNLKRYAASAHLNRKFSVAPISNALLPDMKIKAFCQRLSAIMTAWPAPAAIFVVASFGCTVWWLYAAFSGQESSSWLEPAASVLALLGAFLLAALVILSRKENVRNEASSYGLTRGLATGYYFNYLRPLLTAIRDPQHEIHKRIAAHGDIQIAALVVGIPSTLEEFDPAQHDRLIHTAVQNQRVTMTVHSLEVPIAGRPRPIVTKLVVVPESKTAILLDIPTTLSVVKDFSEFIATHGGGAEGVDDEFIVEACKKLIATSETADFERRLKGMIEEFHNTVGKVSSMETSGAIAAALVHIVATRKLKHRLGELAE